MNLFAVNEGVTEVVLYIVALTPVLVSLIAACLGVLIIIKGAEIAWKVVQRILDVKLGSS